MDMKKFNESVIAEFRANDGKLSGAMEGAPVLLLTTIGRRSGNPHTTPLGFIDAGGKLAVAAANGGSDENPDWFLNIENSNQVSIELPGAVIPSTADIAEGSERQKLLDSLASELPGMTDHVATADREIPVVVLTEAR